MMDVVRKNGDVIDIVGLSSVFRVPVVEISALKGEGVFAAAEAAIEAANAAVGKTKHIFSGEVEHALAHIEEATLHDFPQEKQNCHLQHSQ